MGGKEISESAEKDRHKRRVKGSWVCLWETESRTFHTDICKLSKLKLQEIKRVLLRLQKSSRIYYNRN